MDWLPYRRYLAQVCNRVLPVHCCDWMSQRTPRRSGRESAKRREVTPLGRRRRARAGRPNSPAIGKQSATTWVDRLGAEKAVGLEDILIIAPYNAEVFDLKEKIPGAKIGTVDKFQG